MKSVIAITVAAIAIVATLLPFASMTALAQPTNQTQPEGHLPVSTVQDNEFIVTTVTKNGAHPPEGPIVILPPENNATNGEGNITQLPADSNVTHEGNDTVIIAPPDRNITEVPIGPNENITIIGPPHQNESTQPPAAPPCTCQNQTGNEQQKPIPPVIIAPAPGQNITQVSPPHVDNSLPTPPANANNSGLHPAHPIVIPPESNQPGSNNNGTVSQGGNQTASDNAPKVNPLIPSTTWK